MSDREKYDPNDPERRGVEFATSLPNAIGADGNGPAARCRVPLASGKTCGEIILIEWEHLPRVWDGRETRCGFHREAGVVAPKVDAAELAPVVTMGGKPWGDHRG